MSRLGDGQCRSADEFGHRSLCSREPQSCSDAFTRYDVEVLSMSENTLETIAKLEGLAAWHRINAERAGADWVWEARLRAAEGLERQAAKIRALLSSTGSVKVEIAALPEGGREASGDIRNVNRRTRRRMASSAALPTRRLRKLAADAKKSRRSSHTKAVIREAGGPERRLPRCRRN
jgi:hypothetical protein